MIDTHFKDIDKERLLNKSIEIDTRNREMIPLTTSTPRYSFTSLQEAQKLVDNGTIVRDNNMSKLATDGIFKTENTKLDFYKYLTRVLKIDTEKPKVNIGYTCLCKQFGPNLIAKRDFNKVKLISYTNNIYKCTTCNTQFKLTKSEMTRLRKLVLDKKQRMLDNKKKTKKTKAQRK